MAISGLDAEHFMESVESVESVDELVLVQVDDIEDDDDETCLCCRPQIDRKQSLKRLRTHAKLQLNFAQF